jgi:hypothetical protein
MTIALFEGDAAVFAVDAYTLRWRCRALRSRSYTLCRRRLVSMAPVGQGCQRSPHLLFLRSEFQVACRVSGRAHVNDAHG